MKKNLTHITFLVDRSGSMENIKEDMEGGINSFVEEQKKIEGDARISLYEFDTSFDTVYENKSLDDAKKYKLIPRGGTALLDALGRSIIQTGEILKSTPEEERPEKVLFIIITDGEENSSSEFKLPKIKEMIQHQTEKYNWEFIYLGANQDAISVAGDMGIDVNGTMDFAPTPDNMKSMFRSVVNYSANYRGGNSSKGFSNADRANAI